MSRVGGKIALITGAARGQGRSHALRLAEEGADIIAIDACADVATAPYPLATTEDMDETVAQVEALDRRILAQRADVRDRAQLRLSVDTGLAEFGRIDCLIVNHGIASVASAVDMPFETWQEMIDINLTGVWNICNLVIPQLIRQRSGVIVITSSTLGLRGELNATHYSAAKHGVVGLMRCLAKELGPHGVRVNSVHPSQVETAMVMHQAMFDTFRPDLEQATAEDFRSASQAMHLLPIPILEPLDVSNLVLFLCSDEARCITGTSIPVDAGNLAK
jgi:(+)-trans-carveol dehydrogenase